MKDAVIVIHAYEQQRRKPFKIAKMLQLAAQRGLLVQQSLLKHRMSEEDEAEFLQRMTDLDDMLEVLICSEP